MSKRLQFLYSLLPSANCKDAREILEEIDRIEERRANNWVKEKTCKNN